MREYSVPATVRIADDECLVDPVYDNAAAHPESVSYRRRGADGTWDRGAYEFSAGMADAGADAPKTDTPSSPDAPKPDAPPTADASASDAAPSLDAGAGGEPAADASSGEAGNPDGASPTADASTGSDRTPQAAAGTGGCSCDLGGAQRQILSRGFHQAGFDGPPHDGPNDRGHDGHAENEDRQPGIGRPFRDRIRLRKHGHPSTRMKLDSIVTG